MSGAFLDLIGHGNRANVLPVEYYERPVPVAGSDYVLPENIAERGRQAVRELGDDPVAAVRAASARALATVTAAPDGARVGTPFGEQTLDTYLRSRTAELLLHGVDLGTDVDPPSAALVECGAFLWNGRCGEAAAWTWYGHSAGAVTCHPISTSIEPPAPLRVTRLEVSDRAPGHGLFEFVSDPT